MGMAFHFFRRETYVMKSSYGKCDIQNPWEVLVGRKPHRRKDFMFCQNELKRTSQSPAIKNVVDQWNRVEMPRGKSGGVHREIRWANS